MIIDWTRIEHALDKAFMMFIAGIVASVSIGLPVLLAWHALKILVSFIPDYIL